MSLYRKIRNSPAVLHFRVRRGWKRVLRRKKRWNNRDFLVGRYKHKTGLDLDLDNPQTLSAKLQWMKLYYANPLYTKCADKYGVREYVRSKGHADILNELIGVYESPEDIPFDELPDRFVIKATHGCGWNLICSDKRKLARRWGRWKKIMHSWLRQDFSLYSREMHYAYIPPRLVVEAYLEDGGGNGLNDYKIFCFDGEPQFIHIDVARVGDHRRSYYTTDWQWLDITHTKVPRSDKRDMPPPNLDRMLRIARDLSAGFPHVRVDFYNVDGRIYFGELTFTHGGGFTQYMPADFDLTMGRMMPLPAPGSPYVVK